MEIKIAPSLLASDFLHLESEVRRAEESGADLLHCDVMDGIFVPNISFGFSVLEPLSEITRLPLDLHMMTVCPDRYVDKLAKIGAASVTIHTDAMDGARTVRTLKAIRAAGMKAGAALSPKRGTKDLVPLIELVDMVLVMTVEPGFGGQSFMGDMMAKIREARRMLDRANPACEIQVDGGVASGTIGQAAEAGANVFVVGTASFRADSMAAAVSGLRRTAEAARRG